MKYGEDITFREFLKKLEYAIESSSLRPLLSHIIMFPGVPSQRSLISYAVIVKLVQHETANKIDPYIVAFCVIS